MHCRPPPDLELTFGLLTDGVNKLFFALRCRAWRARHSTVFAGFLRHSAPAAARSELLSVLAQSKNLHNQLPPKFEHRNQAVESWFHLRRIYTIIEFYHHGIKEALKYSYSTFY